VSGLSSPPVRPAAGSEWLFGARPRTAFRSSIPAGIVSAYGPRIFRSRGLLSAGPRAPFAGFGASLRGGRPLKKAGEPKRVKFNAQPARASTVKGIEIRSLRCGESLIPDQGKRGWPETADFLGKGCSGGRTPLQ